MPPQIKAQYLGLKAAENDPELLKHGPQANRFRAETKANGLWDEYTKKERSLQMADKVDWLHKK